MSLEGQTPSPYPESPLVGLVAFFSDLSTGLPRPDDLLGAALLA